MGQLSLADVSKYLTEDVVNRAFKLKTGTQDNVKVIQIERAAPPGAGMIGAVYRLNVRSDHYATSFVVKGMVQDALLRRSLQTEKFFKREILFFSDVLPILSQVQKCSGAKERIQNHIPICFAYHCDGENDFILMEDLQESQCLQISQDPSKTERDAMLKTLAHLHAVSMGLRIKKPEEFKKIADKMPEVYYADNLRDWWKTYLESAIDINLKTLAEYEDVNTSIYYKKFCQLINNDPYGQLVSLTTAESAHLVINHGDPWTFNYYSSKSRAVVIDFQIARCASPSTDLSYMLLLICKQSPKKEYAMDAIQVYYNALSYYLKDMSLDSNNIFSFEDLKDEIKKYGRFGLLAAISTILQLCSNRCDVLADFVSKYGEVDTVPLAELWRLTPPETEEDKQSLVNAVRIAVDLEFV